MLPVIYTPIAERYFKKLKDRPLKEAFKKAIISIRENPDIGEAKTGDLKGLHCLDLYHNRTNYELAYRISQLYKLVAGTVIQSPLSLAPLQC